MWLTLLANKVVSTQPQPTSANLSHPSALGFWSVPQQSGTITQSTFVFSQRLWCQIGHRVYLYRVPKAIGFLVTVGGSCSSLSDQSKRTQSEPVPCGKAVRSCEASSHQAIKPSSHTPYPVVISLCLTALVYSLSTLPTVFSRAFTNGTTALWHSSSRTRSVRQSRSPVARSLSSTQLSCGTAAES